MTKTPSWQCSRLPKSVDWSTSGRLLSQWSNPTAETGSDRKSPWAWSQPSRLSSVKTTVVSTPSPAVAAALASAVFPVADQVRVRPEPVTCSHRPRRRGLGLRRRRHSLRLQRPATWSERRYARTYQASATMTRVSSRMSCRLPKQDDAINQEHRRYRRGPAGVDAMRIPSPSLARWPWSGPGCGSVATC